MLGLLVICLCTVFKEITENIENGLFKGPTGRSIHSIDRATGHIWSFWVYMSKKFLQYFFQKKTSILSWLNPKSKKNIYIIHHYFTLGETYLNFWYQKWYLLQEYLIKIILVSYAFVMCLNIFSYSFIWEKIIFDFQNS